MSISDGARANSTNFNNAFVSRTVDTDTTGKVDLKNTTADSGANVVNAQREINSLNSFTGRASGSAKDVKPTWVNTDIGASDDDIKTKVDNLIQRFNLTAGHTHDGTQGEGPLLDYTALSDVPLRGYTVQGVDLTLVTGGSHDVSSVLLTKLVSINDSQKGVVTNAPYNKCLVRYTTSYDPAEDTNGNQVYGRLTNVGGVGGAWTLTFYVNVSGVETAYSFSGSNNISWWYQELFNPISDDRPIYSEDFFFPSDNALADVPDATSSTSGKVSTGAQDFGGEKNFVNGIATEGCDIATSSSIVALVNTGSFVRITGAGASSLKGIVAPVSGANKRLLIHNSSSDDITIKHQDASATAIDRIITPGGDDVVVAPDSSMELIYETNQSRWVIVSAGTGSSLVGYPEFLGTGDGSTDTFGPLTFVPQSEDSIWVFSNGLWQDSSIWSLVGADIVFVTAPSAGQKISVHYITGGAPYVPVLPSNSFISYEYTLTPSDITAKQITLSVAPSSPTSVAVFIKGAAGPEWFGDGYSISGSILDFDGYSLDGILVAGDKIRFIYVT